MTNTEPAAPMTEQDREDAAVAAVVALTGCDATCARNRVGSILENDALNVETGEVAADYVRSVESLTEQAADLDCHGYAECFEGGHDPLGDPDEELNEMKREAQLASGMQEPTPVTEAVPSVPVWEIETVAQGRARVERAISDGAFHDLADARELLTAVRGDATAANADGVRALDLMLAGIAEAEREAEA